MNASKLDASGEESGDEDSNEVDKLELGMIYNDGSDDNGGQKKIRNTISGNLPLEKQISPHIFHHRKV